jgi:hypothetical protein
MLHVVVDECRPDEAAPSVHDAMADRVRCDEVVDRTGFALAYEVKLEARGARVDDQYLDGRRVP